MASGFSQRGSVSRCFNVYHDFEECISKAGHDIQCLALREDYFECLHHKKQRDRDAELAKAILRADIEERKGKKWKDL
jgi:NADH dehydrogenase (ubiquinone) Fe-S protein 5